MVLSFLHYGLFIALIFYGFRVRFRSADSHINRQVFYYAILAAVSALCFGAGYSSVLGDSLNMARFFFRSAAVCVSGMHLILFYMVLIFPREKSISVLRYFFILLWAVAAYYIMLTDTFLVEVRMQGSVFIHERGPLFLPISGGGLVLGLLGGLILMLRRIKLDSEIFRLQALLVSLGIFLAYLINIVLVAVLPLITHSNIPYLLLPVCGALLVFILAYAAGITRLLDTQAISMAAAGTLLYSGGLLLVSGLGYAFVSRYAASLSNVIVFMLTAAIFILADRIGAFFRSHFRTLIRGQAAYAEKLEESLAALDYAQGRDGVIAEIIDLLKNNIACSAVHLFIENNQGSLALVGSSDEASISGDHSFPSQSPAIDLMLNMDVSILLKTEIVTNYDYNEVKGEFLRLMERFNADALILLREGRTINGALLLGSKLTGGDFLAYDYDTLRRIYGKLFVTAYYLKNVAQESLVMTVDRELEFSEQIIQSLQENMDRIEHEKADIAFMTRSTRKLGGDFIDVIRVSKDRYMFIVGDVSGKGLNASMSMVILKSVIRTFLRETKDFKELVAKTNTFIKEHLPRGTFFAGMFGLFDFSERTLFYVNCGVPIMLLLSTAYNNPVEIQGAGRVLGFVKNIKPHISVRKAAFKPGDILMVTTDGLTDAESMRGVRFGKERIQQSLLENRSASAERLVQFLTDDVIEFMSQELNDDITVLAIKFL